MSENPFSPYESEAPAESLAEIKLRQAQSELDELNKQVEYARTHGLLHTSDTQKLMAARPAARQKLEDACFDKEHEQRELKALAAEIEQRRGNRLIELEIAKTVKAQDGIADWDREVAEALAVVSYDKQNPGLVDEDKVKQAEDVVNERKEFLREKAVGRSRTDDLRKWVNRGGPKEGQESSHLHKLEKSDNQEKGKKQKKSENYSVDHIVPFSTIYEIEGFQDLGLFDQLTVLRNVENIEALEGRVNSAKSNRRLLRPGEDPAKVDDREVFYKVGGRDISNTQEYLDLQRRDAEARETLTRQIQILIERQSQHRAAAVSETRHPEPELSQAAGSLEHERHGLPSSTVAPVKRR